MSIYRSVSVLAVLLAIAAWSASGIFAQEPAPAVPEEAEAEGGKNIIHSKELGWTENQDVTESFGELLKNGELKAGDEFVLDHTYRISGGFKLPDNFTLAAEKGAGFDVTDAVDPPHTKPLLELGSENTLRNLTITYLDTPRLGGPRGITRGVNFTNRIGIQANGKNDILIENCRLVGAIGHHLKLGDCSEVNVVGSHIAGGFWTIHLIGGSDYVFRHCLIEKSQGDGIKTSAYRGKAVRGILVEDCVFQDNGRDGIDTTGGFNDAVVRNTIFRRMGVSGLDLKSFYGGASLENVEPQNVNILIENCLFHDMPNAVVLTTLDDKRRKGDPDLLTAENIKEYAPHDIDINNGVFGFVETPLRKTRDGGYGVDYPTDQGEYTRLILLKDAHSIRYKDVSFFGDRTKIRPVYISSIGGGGALSKEAGQALHTLAPDLIVTGNVLNEPADPIEPGVTETPFEVGPR